MTEFFAGSLSWPNDANTRSYVLDIPATIPCFDPPKKVMIARKTSAIVARFFVKSAIPTIIRSPPV